MSTWNQQTASSVSWTNQSDGGSFSGYLLQENGYHILLEDGSGALLLEQSGFTPTSWSNQNASSAPSWTNQNIEIG